MAHNITKSQLLGKSVDLQFAVVIGITGDIKGKLMVSAELPTFATIGETMFGIPEEAEMLSSFTSELGNMLAGTLSTNIFEPGVNIDITNPTIIQGNTKISGFKQALKITVIFETVGEIDVYLLLDG